jgi:hypothetical protein
VSPSKRFFIISGVAAFALIGSAAPGQAQVRVRSRRVTIAARYPVRVAPLWWYDPWWYDPSWGYGYPPYGYPALYGYAYTSSSLRIQVEPKDTEVYLDGYYAGIVDDFDGVFQRLHTAPGEHDLTLIHDGYRSVTQHVYLAPGNTLDVKLAMDRLAPGEPPPARPVRPASPAGVRQGPARPFPNPNGPPPSYAPPRPPAAPTPESPSGQSEPSSRAAVDMGTLELRVQPADADIRVDGQPWRVPPGKDRVQIDASAGEHTVQIRKPGYVGYVTLVQVRPGETATVDVKLRTEP